MPDRYTKLPKEGRPEHAISDGYPLVVNMRIHPYACVECLDPCGLHTFLYGKPENGSPDCERRHPGLGGYRDGRAARR